MSHVTADIDYKQVFGEIAKLVRETFCLWKEKRVGFRWRHYLPNHTHRVVALCHQLGKCEGGDLIALQFAALLHDITKPYDGTYHTDSDGKRSINSRGYWENEVLLPEGSNAVTRLYDELNLYGSLHHISGAVISEKILNNYNLKSEFIEKVCGIIRAHIKPLNLTREQLGSDYLQIEKQIIYDADTMDANLGFVAFFRNVHIHGHRAIQRDGFFDIEKYVENLRNWIASKQVFADRLFTNEAKRMSDGRQARSFHLYQGCIQHNTDIGLNSKYGVRGLIQYLVDNTDDPNIISQMDYLINGWIPQRQQWLTTENSANQEKASYYLSQVVNFHRIINEEIQGLK